MDNLTGVDETSQTTPMVYAVKVFMRTESGTARVDASQALEFNVIVTDPCAPVAIPKFKEFLHQIDGDKIVLSFASLVGSNMGLCPFVYSYDLTTVSSPIGDADLYAYAMLNSDAYEVVIRTESGVQPQTLQFILTAFVSNGQTFSTQFTGTYTEHEFMVQAHQNKPPYFREATESQYILDFSEGSLKLNSNYIIGQLVDDESDLIAIEQVVSNTTFTSTSIDAESNLKIQLDLAKAAKFGNGNYTV